MALLLKKALTVSLQYDLRVYYYQIIIYRYYWYFAKTEEQIIFLKNRDTSYQVWCKIHTSHTRTKLGNAR